MDCIHVEIAREIPSFGEQNLNDTVHPSIPRSDAVTATIQRGMDRVGSPHRILVVDDDIDICQFCSHVMVGSGYQVDTATDGAAGWQALHTRDYDLLLTDNRMPMVSGIELVKKMRSVRMDLPVVLASSVIPTVEIDRNPSLRLAGTLLKPFTTSVLLDTVGKILRTNPENNG